MDNVKAAASAAIGAAETVAGTVVDVAKETAVVVGGTVAAVGEKLGATPPAPLPLPDERTQLMTLHREARRRRDAAPLMSRERADAVHELERIEVHIARVERAMDPPLV